jgi:hypothetical protein
MSAPEKGEDIIFNAAMLSGAGMVLSVIFAMFDAGAWCLVFWFGATAYSIIYAFKGFQKIQEREKKWEIERPERARERERAMAGRARIRREITVNEAYTKEEDLDYAGALRIWESLGDRSEAKRIRKKMREEGKVKVDQTVVHGDYVDDRDTTYIDDRDTIIKDSVVNRSNIGGGSKAEGLREAKSLFEEGLIDESEYKQMKKEILGK